MSGGQDSIASLLHLIDLGVDRDRGELWYRDVDGREGSALMVWHFMADYNRHLADAFGMPCIFLGWREALREMLKQDSYSRSHKIETSDGLGTLSR